MSSAVQPADVAAKAMQAVHDGERDTWVGLFAPDALLEDPVGHVPPRRGAEEVAAFWDTGIAALEEVRFEVRRVHQTQTEALILVDVAVRAPGGASASYDAALHYTLDETGAIASLRAFWDLPAVMAQFAAAAAS